MKTFSKITILLKLQICIYVIVFLASCKTESKTEYTYPNDIRLSNSFGTPLDSSSYYFPFKIGNVLTGADTLTNRVYSSIMNSMKEPILYNYYLDADIFRLIVIESWKPVKIIKFQKNNNDILVMVKVINAKDNNFFPMADTLYINENGTIEKRKKFNANNKGKGNVTFDSKTLRISNGWEDMIMKIKTNHFWEIKNTNGVQGLDGTKVILEGHTKTRYWFVNRWQPTISKEDKAIKDLCDYITEKTGEKINWEGGTKK